MESSYYPVWTWCIKSRFVCKNTSRAGGPDGIALDSKGNLFVCHNSLGKVFCYDTSGYHFLTIDCSHIGKTVTNCCFGGLNMNELFITISDMGTVAKVKLETPGKKLFLPKIDKLNKYKFTVAALMFLQFTC